MVISGCHIRSHLWWRNDLTSLCLDFPIYQMGIITVPTPLPIGSLWEFSELLWIKEGWMPDNWCFRIVWTDCLGKTLVMGKTEGKKRRGQQRIRMLDSIIDSMDMSLSKLWEMVKDREAWRTATHGVTKSQTWMTKRVNNSNAFSTVPGMRCVH